MYPRLDDQSGLYGYWYRKSWVIRPQYQYAYGFANRYAAVNLVDGRPGLIGVDGTLFLLDAICGGRIPIQESDYTFSGFGGYESQPPRFAAVRTEISGQHEWGLIDSHLAYRPLPHDVFTVAKTVRPCVDHVVIFHATGRGAESICGLFNLSDMRTELPIKYSCIYPSNDPIWVVSRTTNERDDTPSYAFYDVSKQQFLPGWFTFALPFSCGLGAVRMGEWDSGGHSYFVDKDLRPAFKDQFDDVGPFSHGLAAVYKDGDAGYIDTTGRMRLLLSYEHLLPFNEFGLAIANRNQEEWDIDIIDRKGQAKLRGLETAVFWEGDFPYFEITKNGEDHLYNMDLDLIF